MNAGGAQPRGHLGHFRGAVQMHFPGQIAAPAWIGTDDQPAQLAQLRLAPLQIDMQRHLPQCGSTMQASLQPHHPGIGLLQAHVGASRLAAQLDAPLPRP